MDYILDLNDYLVVPTDIASPLHCQVVGCSHPQAPVAVAVRRVGPDETPLRWAAKHCFWRLGQEPVKKLLRSRGLPAPQWANLAQLLRALLDDVLPDFDIKDIVSLLEQRLKHSTNDAVLQGLPEEVLEECFTAQEVDELKAPGGAHHAFHVCVMLYMHFACLTCMTHVFHVCVMAYVTWHSMAWVMRVDLIL